MSKLYDTYISLKANEETIKFSACVRNDNSPCWLWSEGRKS